MATAARSHGGDGAGDPSPGSWRPSSGCQVSQKKNVRDKASNNIYFEKKSELGRKLPIEFDRRDRGTYAPVGPYGAGFPRFIRNVIDAAVPKYYKSWDDVPGFYESDIVIRELEECYDLESQYGPDPTRCEVRKSIHAICARRYASIKNKFKEKYVEPSGAFDNAVVARENPPDGIPNDEWQKILDFFFATPFNSSIKKNSINRGKQRYSSLHGTKSLVRQRFEEQDAEGNFPPLINSYKKIITRKVMALSTMKHELPLKSWSGFKI